MKVCTKCGSEKAVSEFGKNKTCKDGLMNHCKACKKAELNAWMAKNRDSYLAKKKEYRENNKESVAEGKRRWRKANPEIEKARIVNWQKANPERAKEINRNSQIKHKDRVLEKAKEWGRKNPDKIREKTLKWQKNNKHRLTANRARRRARELQATVSWANDFFIQEAYALARLRTQLHGFEWHVDHIVPLQGKNVCGLHVHNNLQVIPATENIRKHARRWPDMP